MRVSEVQIDIQVGNILVLDLHPIVSGVTLLSLCYPATMQPTVQQSLRTEDGVCLLRETGLATALLLRCSRSMSLLAQKSGRVQLAEKGTELGERMQQLFNLVSACVDKSMKQFN